MVVGPPRGDHAIVDIFLAVALVSGLSLTGAGFAVSKALKPGETPGRQGELWILAVLLGLVALGTVLVGYWLWRFTLDFTW